MNNLEHAIEILEDEHDPFAGPIDAPSLAYALNGAGLIAPDLPEPRPCFFPREDGQAFGDGGRYDTWSVETEGEKVLAYAAEDHGNYPADLTPDGARALAGAILAAADYAEKAAARHARNTKENHDDQA